MRIHRQRGGEKKREREGKRERGKEGKKAKGKVEPKGLEFVWNDFKSFVGTLASTSDHFGVTLKSNWEIVDI